MVLARATVGSERGDGHLEWGSSREEENVKAINEANLARGTTSEGLTN